MHKAVVIIPARLGSTRLPAKPLLNKTGKPLIWHTYQQACKAKFVDKVIIATDSMQIKRASEGFGAISFLTSKDHDSGTSRVAEVAKKLNYKLIVNLQVDEPEIPPQLIDKLVLLLQKHYYVTIASRFRNQRDINNPQRVKVVVDREGYAMYFSRSPIPYPGNSDALLHVGIYGYHKDFLLKFIKMRTSKLERMEKLEQLRALEYGYKLKVLVSNIKMSGGIDTVEDYNNFVRRYTNA